MEIKKALITAAGKNQRTLPLQTLVDRDGVQKAALLVIIEEILKSGIDEIGIVIQPGDQDSFRAAAGAHAGRLTFVEQKEPLGYANAVFTGRAFTGGNSFLLLVGDHLYLSRAEKGCAEQLLEVARAENCAVSAVQPTHESKLPYYGAVGGLRIQGRNRLYEVETILEKPTPTVAEEKLMVPGLRAGQYLCFFGMHVFTPTLMDILQELHQRTGDRSGMGLAQALQQMATQERYLALEMEGNRFDIGVKYGLLNAQLALALNGSDRDEVLTRLVELLALQVRLQ
ncbi:MAG: Nucleotidyl transferase [Verrucomicrobiales bacterium]|nr:Nucleotidyl transferase [Verrucomicrobiales bacterium]